MLSHEIVRAIEQDRQRSVEWTLARMQLEGTRPGRKARLRAAVLRWLGAVPVTPNGCPAAGPTSPLPTAAAAASPAGVKTRSA